MVPAFVLVDHGHFQYNCVMVGLVLAAYLAMIKDHNEVACLLFTIALFTKQMALYYALGFFSVLVGKALASSRILITSSFKLRLTAQTIIDFLVEIGKFAIIVIAVTLAIWSPWISTNNPSLILEPLQAIFPVHRGTIPAEDVLFKWESRFSSNTLVILCGVLTLLASLPSVIVGVLFPSKTKLTLLVLLNISLSFFLFSYHVHEKTILVPLLFVSVGFHLLGRLALDFSVVSSFILFHLLREDGLTLQYLVVNLAFLYFAQPSVNTLRQMTPISYERVEQECESPLVNTGNKFVAAFDNAYQRVLRKLLYLLIIFLHLGDAVMVPPEKLPYLFHLLFSLLGFVFFLSFWVVCNVRMLCDATALVQGASKKKHE